MESPNIVKQEDVTDFVLNKILSYNKNTIFIS